MNLHALKATVRALFANDKGILAMDESIQTCNAHFSSAGIKQTLSARRAWRELIISTPNLADSISGVILCDETIRQATISGTPFTHLLEDADILIGIKVDGGTQPMPDHYGETITDGLIGLEERLTEYQNMGATFAKWRAVFHLGSYLPSRACINENCTALARYARNCQEAGLVPIVEPEILMEGDHTLAQSFCATEKVLHNLFRQLHLQHVVLEMLILKPNMILPGLKNLCQSTIEAVSTATLRCLRQNVPAAVGGIAFLSGGQSPELASARLNALEILSKTRDVPWPIGFSFARAIQQPALNIWQGRYINTAAAQRALSHRAQCDQAARRGLYKPEMEMA